MLDLGEGPQEGLIHTHGDCNLFGRSEDPKRDTKPPAPDTCDHREAYIYVSRKKLPIISKLFYKCSMTHCKKNPRGDLFNSSPVALGSGSKLKIRDF